MSDTALATRAEAHDLEAELNYIATGIERPRTYTYQPPDGESRTNIVNDPHHVPIQDMHARALDMQAEKALLLKCFLITHKPQPISGVGRA